jgi:anti-sigma factor RsiW
MNGCRSFRPLLDDLVDGTLTHDAETSVWSHLERCPRCRQEAEDLRRLVEQARQLHAADPEPVPRRDLWPNIEQRLTPSGQRRPVLLVAAAAVVAAAMGALIAMLALRQLPEGPTLAQQTAPTSTAVVAASRTAPSLAHVDQQFRTVRSELIAVIDSRREQLPAETVAMIDDNLEIIDAALQQIRAALDADPSNTELRHLFVATYRKEIDFLQKMARFSADGTA